MAAWYHMTTVRSRDQLDQWANSLHMWFKAPDEELVVVVFILAFCFAKWPINYIVSKIALQRFFIHEGVAETNCCPNSNAEKCIYG